MSKILIAEDDPNISKALAIRLRQDGHDILHATDAMTATSTAIRECPDLIILDISMPAGDGFQVAERLKRNDRTTMIPFIVITASKKPGLRERAGELGARAYFEKPYEGKMLTATVRSILNAAA